METRLSNILKTTNIKKFIKINLKIKLYLSCKVVLLSCKVVLGTYNLVAQTRHVCLLKAVEFLATFDIQIFRQRFIACDNFTYKSLLLLKLRAVELAISFLSLSLRSS